MRTKADHRFRLGSWPDLLMLPAVLAGILLLSSLSPARADETERLLLGLPIDCTLGSTCWLVNLMDHDPSRRMKDYNCLARGYDGHKGTDFAIGDYSVMADGVNVIASAAGHVKSVRDGMLDGDVSLVGRAEVAGRECGNGVVLKHPGGWETQYCHLRRLSIVVRSGDRVSKGQKLGEVGSSGVAQFPHAHLTVRKDRKTIDPFVGLERKAACGLGTAPLWEPKVLRALKTDMTTLYDAGFAANEPNAIALHQGFYRNQVMSAKADALVFWTTAFWVERDDRLTLSITSPSGRELISRTTTLRKNQARYLHFVGKKRGVDFRKGTYIGRAMLRRKSASGETQEFVIERNLEIR